jgi:antitoxin component YwqK of YwqJK toxin-antitoxin module
MWYDNGQLLTEEKYRDGRTDGPFVSYYPSGVKHREGAMNHGERIGKWVEYEKDGTVEEVTNYSEDERDGDDKRPSDKAADDKGPGVSSIENNNSVKSH